MTFPAEGKANAWIGCVGLLMTAVFVRGIILRPQRRRLGIGGLVVVSG